MVIYCSKALQISLKLTKDNMAQIETIQESVCDSSGCISMGKW